MIPTDIIKKYYPENSDIYKILVEHSFAVADKALSIIQAHRELLIDKQFVYESALLHDIGIFLTDAAEIYCFGKYPYICHGYLGSDLLKKEGLPRHALVCERHTGTGLSSSEIISNQLPLPHREMMPVSMEEQLVCFADKFFSKTKLNKEKPIDKIRKSLAKHGKASVVRFDNWCKLFLE